MDRLTKVDNLVFDKTGTLSKRKPEVTEIRTFGGVEESELLRLVAEAETGSEHIWGQPIVKEAEARGITLNREPAHAEVMMSRKDLASFLGTTPETLRRKLSLFEDEGWIEQHGQREIRILDLDALLLL